MKKYKILVVCSANRGRSASYHAHMKHLLKDRGIDHIEIDSAGVDAPVIKKLYEGGHTKANEMVVDILNRRGITEINEHRIKQLTRELVEGSDIILAYNTRIRDQIKEAFPEDKEKVYTVRGYTTEKEGDLPSEALDVDDAAYPTGKLYRGKITPKTHKAFNKVCDESKRLAKKTLDKILEDINKQ